MSRRGVTVRRRRVSAANLKHERFRGDSAVRFTKTYLQQFEQALKTHSDSAGVIKAMEAQWPGLAETSSLELSAKVNTGEMKW